MTQMEASSNRVNKSAFIKGYTVEVQFWYENVKQDLKLLASDYDPELMVVKHWALLIVNK